MPGPARTTNVPKGSGRGDRTIVVQNVADRGFLFAREGQPLVEIADDALGVLQVGSASTDARSAARAWTHPEGRSGWPPIGQQPEPIDEHARDGPNQKNKGHKGADPHAWRRRHGHCS